MGYCAMNSSYYVHISSVTLFPLACRVSVDSGTVNSVQSSDELAHPSLAALRGGDSRDRKISWSPGSKLICIVAVYMYTVQVAGIHIHPWSYIYRSLFSNQSTWYIHVCKQLPAARGEWVVM